MQSAFFKSVCQIGIFMVCAQTITHFRPNSSYEKYIKLLVSVMVLIQILQPVSSLFHLGGGRGQKERIRQFEEQFGAGMADSMEEISRAEQILENMTLREVQKALEQEKQESESGNAVGQMKEAGKQEQSEKERKQESSGVAEESESGNAVGQMKAAGKQEQSEKEMQQGLSEKSGKIEKVEKIKIGLDGAYGQQD